MANSREVVLAAKAKMEATEKALRELVDGPRKADFRFEHKQLVDKLREDMNSFLDALAAEGKEHAGGI
jgi:hypothetical protein